MQVQEHQGGLGYLFNEQEGHDQPPTQQHKQFFLSSISSSSSGVPTSNLQNIESSPNKEAVLTEEQLLCSALPPESEVYDYPVALIQNAYDGSNFESLDVEFFIELEVIVCSLVITHIVLTLYFVRCPFRLICLKRVARAAVCGDSSPPITLG